MKADRETEALRKKVEQVQHASEDDRDEVLAKVKTQREVTLAATSKLEQSKRNAEKLHEEVQKKESDLKELQSRPPPPVVTIINNYDNGVCSIV